MIKQGIVKEGDTPCVFTGKPSTDVDENGEAVVKQARIKEVLNSPSFKELGALLEAEGNALYNPLIK